MRFVEALRRNGVHGRRRDASPGRRAAIAAVFRTHQGREQVLFIRRAVNPRDPWSGNVALPGGRQDAADGGDDEATAIRETLEETGLDLRTPHWERLGRLVEDRIAGGGPKSLAVAMYGFAARSEGGESHVALTLQPTEVAAAWWVDTAVIHSANLEWRAVDTSALLRTTIPLAASLLRALRLDTLFFAAIPLPPPAAETGAGAAGDPHAAAAAPLPPSDPRRSEYELWGLTLAFFSDLLRASSAGQPLVGEGAPPAFARAFTASAQSPVARSAAWLLESVRLRGARRTALTLAGASTMLLAAAVSVGIAVARLK